MMSEKLNIIDTLIDDTPSDFSAAIEMTDAEYAEYRASIRKKIIVDADKHGTLGKDAKTTDNIE